MIDHGGNMEPRDFELNERLSSAPAKETMKGFLHYRMQHIHRQAAMVDKAARATLKGQKPAVLWFTGLSGAGKTTIANLVEKLLHENGKHTCLLDGDDVRHGLSSDLGFTDADRVENIRRVTEVAKLMVDAGLIVLVSLISPFRLERRMAREMMAKDEFIEVFVDTPIEECARRDPKGLYKRAMSGEIRNFTGVSSPYEAPERPELHIRTVGYEPFKLARCVYDYLELHVR